MGYCYDSRTGALVCDRCGHSRPEVEDVRRRTCPYKVLGSTHKTTSKQRHAVAYCSPPALCRACYRARGGLRGVHGDRCKEGAARYQAEADAEQALLDSGAFLLSAGFGDHDPRVPEGKVGALFEDRDGRERFYLVDKDEYRAGYGANRATPKSFPSAILIEEEVLA